MTSNQIPFHILINFFLSKKYLHSFLWSIFHEGWYRVHALVFYSFFTLSPTWGICTLCPKIKYQTSIPSLNNHIKVKKKLINRSVFFVFNIFFFEETILSQEINLLCLNAFLITMGLLLRLLINNYQHVVSISYLLETVLSILLKLFHIIITKDILGVLFTNNVTDPEK